MTPDQLQKRLDREKRARKSAEELLELKSAELYELNTQLRKAHREALETSRLKSQFLATMSHEIRTPMNGVLGMLHLLLESDLGSQQKEFADTARRSAEWLLGIINDILDFSRIEAGKLSTEQVPFPLRQLVEDTLELLQERAEAKGLELTCWISPQTPPMVMGDPGRLRQILVNLAGNGLKFTETGEVGVRMTAAGEGPQTRVRVTVADTGIGVAKEAQAHLFEPFRQADGSMTRRFGGTGLGLSIVSELVKLMGGELGFTSQEGMGSEFWFELPLPAVAGEQAGELPPPLAGMRVLVVEDNRTARAHLANLLQHWGALAEEAASGAEALRLLGGDGDGPRYEAALVDMTLEEGGGLALLARIRQLPAKRQPAVVLLTGLRYRGREAHLRQLGAYEGLCKPVRESKLLVTLERIQGRPQAATAGAPEAPAESDAGNCGCHILVVDDNRVNLKVAATLLARMGYSVATATNGREAVEAVAEGQYKMVLMDCQMPVMDGFAATAAIRRLDESVRNVPIVAVTANAMSGDRERCLRAGMDDYLSKPIRKDQLREILGRLCTSDQPAETASEEPSPAGRSG